MTKFFKKSKKHILRPFWTLFCLDIFSHYLPLCIKLEKSNDLIKTNAKLTGETDIQTDRQPLFYRTLRRTGSNGKITILTLPWLTLLFAQCFNLLTTLEANHCCWLVIMVNTAGWIFQKKFFVFSLD